MPNYLRASELQSVLDAGRAIEQWLGCRAESDDRVIEWLRIHRDKLGRFEVTRFEVYDEGNRNFCDVYEFHSIEPDEPFGTEQLFDDSTSALKYATEVLGASEDRFVGSGMIQAVYLQYLRDFGELPKNRAS